MSFLLAEQNTNMALRYADYGYILENGRVVMDGEAKALRENEDVKEFYLGVAGGERKSFRDVQVLQAPQALAGLISGSHRSDRRIDDRHLRRRSKPAIPTRASASCSAALPRPDRARACSAPGWARACSPASMPQRVTSRAALAKLPVLRKSDLLALQKQRSAVRRLQRHGARQGAAPADVARADLRAGRRRRATSGGAARALFAAGFRAGDLVHNSFSYHLTPGGFIMESGAHALGCAVIPGRHRQDRAAARGDRASASPPATSARRTS